MCVKHLQSQEKSIQIPSEPITINQSVMLKILNIIDAQHSRETNLIDVNDIAKAEVANKERKQQWSNDCIHHANQY